MNLTLLMPLGAAAALIFAYVRAKKVLLESEGNELMQVLKFNEIVAYEYLGDFKQATVLMQKYISTYPDDAKAQREYEFLQTR